MPLSINPINIKSQSILSNQLHCDKLYFLLKFTGNAQYVCVSVCVCESMWVPEAPTYDPSLLNNFILYFSFNGYGTKLWV